MRSLEDFKTTEELNKWASERGLMNDDIVNLRRVEIMANAVTNQREKVDYVCDACGQRFTEKTHLSRHKRTIHSDKKQHQCSVCFTKFNRVDSLQRHSKVHSRKRKCVENENDSPPAKISTTKTTAVCQPAKTASAEMRHCNWCTQKKVLLPNKKFCADCDQQGRECKWCHRPLPERFYSERTDICDRCVRRRQNWTNRQQQGGGRINALEGTAQSEVIEPNAGNLWDILQFFVDNKVLIQAILTDRLTNVKGVKWFMTLFVKFVKYNQNNEAVYAEPTFRSVSFACTNASQIQEQMAEAFQHLHNSYQNFERDGSGWSIDKILKLEVISIEYIPLEGSSYIQLPAKFQKKKAVLNIQNNDQKCFIWSILGSLHSVSRKDHAERVSNYVQYERELNTQAIDFPTPLSQIPEFEKNNDISVNVFGLENNEVYPLQITKFRSMPHHVNLLLTSKGEARHFCLIKNLNRLLGDRTSHKAQSFYCNYCLHRFSSANLLHEHILIVHRMAPRN